MEQKSIPSELDWGDYKTDEDALYSHKIFFGKSLAEALSRFQQQVLEACDELRFMPEVPFRYYIFAYEKYVTSADLIGSSTAADAASCFLDLIAEKLVDAPHVVAPILSELMPALEYVAKNQALFEAGPDIYGDFLVKLNEIKAHERGAR